MSLHIGKEVFGSLHAGEYHSFAKHGSHLGATDVEYIAMSGYERQVIITCLRHQSITQACSVNKKTKIIFLASGIECLKFFPGIYHAQFGRHGDIYHTWLNHVRVGLIGQEDIHIGSQCIRI